MNKKKEKKPASIQGYIMTLAIAPLVASFFISSFASAIFLGSNIKNEKVTQLALAVYAVQKETATMSAEPERKHRP